MTPSATSGTGEVGVERHGDVAVVRLANPGKHNALTVRMWRLVPEVFAGLATDSSVRVVVLTGAGPSFCAGSDINDLAEHHVSDLPSTAETAIATCPKAVVAAVQGYCLGGGLQLAAACDLRIAAVGSTFGVPPARLGIVYPLTATRRLLSMVGPAATKYLIFTGDRIDETRALHIGLVDEVVAADTLWQRTMAVATQIAGLSQLTIQATKQIVDALVAGDEVAGTVDRWTRRAAAGPDVHEGVASFLARRPPRFTWEADPLPGLAQPHEDR